MKILLLIFSFIIFSSQAVGEKMNMTPDDNYRYQFDQDVKELKNGGFTMVYTSEYPERWTGKGNIYDKDGNVLNSSFLGEHSVIHISDYEQRRGQNLRVTQLSDSNILVLWRKELAQNNISGIIYDHITLEPLENEAFLITDKSTSIQSIDSFDDGFVVLYSDENDGLTVIKYNNTGEIIETIEINQLTSFNDYTIKAWKDGSFLVVYSYSGDVYGVIVDENGVAGTTRMINDHTPSEQYYANVVLFEDKSAFVVWHSNGQFDGYDIIGSVITNSTIGEDILINSDVTSTQESPSISKLMETHVVIVWKNGEYQIQSALFDKQGNRTANDFIVQENEEQQSSNDGKIENPRVSTLVDNRIVYTWQESGTDGSGIGVFGKIEQTRIEINNLTIQEDGYKILNNSEFNVISNLFDSDKTVVKCSNFKGIKLLNNELVEITEFTVKELEDREVFIFHDPNTATGLDQNPLFECSIDTEVYETEKELIEIELETINDNKPVLSKFEFTIKQGETLVLTTDMISASDDDTEDEISFLITNLKRCVFDCPSCELTQQVFGWVSFNLKQVEDGEVSVVHDGSVYSPSFKIIVVGGNNYNGEIHFIRKPILSIATGLTQKREETITLTSQHIIVENQDVTDEEIVFQTGNFVQCALLFDGEENQLNFTLADLKAGRVSVVHQYNSSNTEEKWIDPSFEIYMEGDFFLSEVETISFTLEKTNIYPAMLFGFSFTIKEEEKIQITEDMIEYYDADVDTELDDLLILFSEMQSGMFYKESSTLDYSFTLQEVKDGLISFQHNNSNSNSSPIPSFKVAILDGKFLSDRIDAEINFFGKSSLSINEGKNISIGETKVLTLEYFSIEDQYVEDSEMQILITEAVHCQIYFQNSDSSLEEIDSFTLEDIKLGKIFIVHNETSFLDDPTVSPYFKVQLYDGNFYSDVEQVSLGLIEPEPEPIVDDSNGNELAFSISIGFTSILFVLLVIAIIIIIVLGFLVFYFRIKKTSPKDLDSTIQKEEKQIEMEIQNTNEKEESETLKENPSGEN